MLAHLDVVCRFCGKTGCVVLSDPVSVTGVVFVSCVLSCTGISLQIWPSLLEWLWGLKLSVCVCVCGVVGRWRWMCVWYTLCRAPQWQLPDWWSTSVFTWVNTNGERHKAMTTGMLRPCFGPSGTWNVKWSHWIDWHSHESLYNRRFPGVKRAYLCSLCSLFPCSYTGTLRMRGSHSMYEINNTRCVYAGHVLWCVCVSWCWTRVYFLKLNDCP